MAGTRRKAPAKGAQDSTPPGQPTWRKPPAHRRARQRRNASEAEKFDLPAVPRRAVRRPPSQPAPEPAGTLLRRAGLFLLVALVIAGLIAMLQLPAFRVSGTSTHIGGVWRIPRDALYRGAEIEGRSIFMLRPRDVAARVRKVEGIARADVHLRLPNQVIIDAEEVVPLVAWQGSTTVWLSAEGKTVPQLGDPPPIALVDETGTPAKDIEKVQGPVLKSLVALHSARPDVREVFYGKQQGIYLKSEAGWQAWIGHAGSIVDKLVMLEATAQRLSGQGIHPQVIDLRFDDRQAFWW